MALSLDRTVQTPPISRPAWQVMTWLEYEQWREQSPDRKELATIKQQCSA
jgi:hypothetical protein